MVAPVLKVSDALEGFAARARLAPWVETRLWRRLEAWDPALFTRLDHVDADQLPGSQFLILHDPGDVEAPFPSAAELAVLRPGTSLVPVPGSGHNGVLHHPQALEQVARFAARTGPQSPAEV